MYYAEKNYYATETSPGFVNTRYYIGFETRALRDLHVAAATDMATCVARGQYPLADYYREDGQLMSWEPLHSHTDFNQFAGKHVPNHYRAQFAGKHVPNHYGPRIDLVTGQIG